MGRRLYVHRNPYHRRGGEDSIFYLASVYSIHMTDIKLRSLSQMRKDLLRTDPSCS